MYSAELSSLSCLVSVSRLSELEFNSAKLSIERRTSAGIDNCRNASPIPIFDDHSQMERWQPAHMPRQAEVILRHIITVGRNYHRDDGI